jgi:hypothetical protein
MAQPHLVELWTLVVRVIKEKLLHLRHQDPVDLFNIVVSSMRWYSALSLLFPVTVDMLVMSSSFYYYGWTFFWFYVYTQVYFLTYLAFTIATIYFQSHSMVDVLILWNHYVIFPHVGYLIDPPVAACHPGSLIVNYWHVAFPGVCDTWPESPLTNIPSNSSLHF